MWTSGAAWTLAVATAMVAIAATWLLLDRRRPADRQITRLAIALPEGHRITSAPAISPDGRTIAYAARDETGQSSLYLRDLDAFEPRRVSDASARNPAPFFSPDGRWIAYFARGALMKAPTSGGAPVEVAPARYPLGGTWLVDGSIVYTPDINAGLHRVSVDSRVETLTEPKLPDSFAHAWPEAMPGGREILYGVWGVNQGMALLSLESRQSRPVIRRVFGGRFVPPAHLLAFTWVGEVRAAPFDSTSGVVGPVDTAVLNPVYGDSTATETWLAVAPNGTLVYVPGSEAGRSLAWLDRAGRVEAARSPGSPSGLGRRRTRSAVELERLVPAR